MYLSAADKLFKTQIAALEKKVSELTVAQQPKVLSLGYESIETLGCRQGDTSVDNGAILTKYADANPGTEKNLYVPPGEWHCASSIGIKNTCINIVGHGKHTAILRFPKGVNGIKINRTPGNWMGHGNIEKVHIIASGKIPIVEGQDHDGADWNCSGIQLWQRYRIYDVVIDGFSNNGIQIYGDVTKGFDASFFALHNVFIQNMGGDAIWAVGPDSNAGNALGIDIRDCGGVGIRDQSFLGNYWSGVMVHECKKGPFIVANVTTCATVVGCYFESGQPPAQFSSRNNYIVGGLLESGVEGGVRMFKGLFE